MQKYIDIAIVVLKIFKVVKQTTFPWNLTQSKPDVNGVKGNNSRVRPINFCGWTSKIFHDLLKFHGKPFLHLSENLIQYSVDPLHHDFSKFLIYP